MIDDGKNLEPPAEPFHRVQQPAVFLQFEMQVVAGGRPRASDLPDALPDTDRFTFPYKDPAHVRVQGGVSTPMADMDGPAVTRTVAGGVTRPFPAEYTGSPYGAARSTPLWNILRPLRGWILYPNPEDTR